jgi:UDP-3-O-[3-hydroxymyristoyl] N-acetylglucosamine deacetylase
MCTQKTIKHPVKCKSVGLHSGRKINMTIKPADVDEGITFYRMDLPHNNAVKATPLNVYDTTLATTLGTNGTRVSTVEHLLSALFGMNIDNANIEIDSFEIPIMDGSALPFVRLLREAGIKMQKKAKRFMVIREPVSVNGGEGKAMFIPSDKLEITYNIEFKHPVIGRQTYNTVFSSDAYEKDICRARTFGFLHEVEFLQAKGLALGGSLNNAIVLDEKKIINKEGLRCPDEFVKHKILDAIGDLSLLGMPIIGHFIAEKSGHKLNNLLLRKILEEGHCYDIVHYLNGRKEIIDETIDIHPSPVSKEISVSH